MSDSSLKYQALHLQLSGTDAMPDVLQMLRDSALSDLCYAYKIRTKPEVKLIEKVLRKRQSKPQYSLANITDVVGLRLVALFRAEMADIFEGVLLAITHANGIRPNPFIKADPEEVIIYKGTNAFDDLPPRLRDIAGRLCPGVQIKEENSREGYSSVHLVARLDACPKETPCDGYNIPIEIQIRSVFEDAWGEIDHKYGYVIRSGKDTGKPINNPEFVLSHLKVLKRFSDACMEYADAIRTEAVGVPPQLVATKKVVPVASDSLILDKFRSLGVSEGLIERYVEARTLKDDSAVLMEQDIGRGKEQYLSAAELFRELVSQISPESSSGEQLFYYYLRMNEALCLMSTNERDQVVAAHGIYQSLEGRYPDYPLLKMRLGQSLGKLGHLDAAIVFLRQAGEMAAQAAQEYGGKSSAAWPDWLPHVDYEHIAHTQPKLLGYHIWLKIHTMSHRDEKLMGELFEEAYNVTWKGLGAVQHQPKQELSLHNNLLYFSLGMLTRISTLGADGHVDERAILDRVEQHIAYIEKHVADIKDLQVSAVDTLMRAYSILERQTEAVRAAEILLDKCLGTSESPETTTELDANERLNAVGLARRVIKGEIVNLID